MAEKYITYTTPISHEECGPKVPLDTVPSIPERLAARDFPGSPMQRAEPLTDSEMAEIDEIIAAACKELHRLKRVEIARAPNPLDWRYQEFHMDTVEDPRPIREQQCNWKLL